jgi:hypothetical protein
MARRSPTSRRREGIAVVNGEIREWMFGAMGFQTVIVLGAVVGFARHGFLGRILLLRPRSFAYTR